MRCCAATRASYVSCGGTGGVTPPGSVIGIRATSDWYCAWPSTESVGRCSASRFFCRSFDCAESSSSSRPRGSRRNAFVSSAPSRTVSLCRRLRDREREGQQQRDEQSGGHGLSALRKNAGSSVFRCSMKRMKAASSMPKTIDSMGRAAKGKMQSEIRLITNCSGAMGRMVPAATRSSICAPSFPNNGGSSHAGFGAERLGEKLLNALRVVVQLRDQVAGQKRILHYPASCCVRAGALTASG